MTVELFAGRLADKIINYNMRLPIRSSRQSSQLKQCDTEVAAVIGTVGRMD